MTKAKDQINVKTLTGLDAMVQPASSVASERKDGCKGYQDYWGNSECGYRTTLACDDCKYSAAGGRKDPEAKCNQPQR